MLQEHAGHLFSSRIITQWLLDGLDVAGDLLRLYGDSDDAA